MGDVKKLRYETETEDCKAIVNYIGKLQKDFNTEFVNDKIIRLVIILLCIYDNDDDELAVALCTNDVSKISIINCRNCINIFLNLF